MSLIIKWAKDGLRLLYFTYLCGWFLAYKPSETPCTEHMLLLVTEDRGMHKQLHITHDKLRVPPNVNLAPVRLQRTSSRAAITAYLLCFSLAIVKPANPTCIDTLLVEGAMFITDCLPFPLYFATSKTSIFTTFAIIPRF